MSLSLGYLLFVVFFLLDCADVSFVGFLSAAFGTVFLAFFFDTVFAVLVLSEVEPISSGLFRRSTWIGPQR